MRRSLAPGVVEVIRPQPELPEALRGGAVVESCAREGLPTPDSLREWLLARGLDTSDWGAGNTKGVEKLWEEILGDESGLELWRKPGGELQPVRVTHVLRAKVCSPESHKRGIFLLNTWQQYGDGRKRIRNGLLSEKLTISEMPLERNLHAVCQRAVTEEEMQRLAESLFRIAPGSPAPAYDPSYVCPLSVVDEYFDDHVIEVEASKSYPRLLTMYHLYTVDILCSGLPTVDFNTLEFGHAGADGERRLKYVHAWVWTEWSQIQRYLFEGSSLKERKARGAFGDAGALRGFLSNFNLDLPAWGQRGFKSVEALFSELENQESQLELWGRTDGVPLLMRVLHVLQLKVSSADPRMRGKFLCQTWVQTADGVSKPVHRLMSAKLRACNLPFDRQRFAEEARVAIREGLTHLVDAFFNLDPGSPPSVAGLERQQVEVRSVEPVDHRVDVVESPTFRRVCTLYHLYTVNVECEGLPLADFASLEVSGGAPDGKPRVRRAMGWCWVTWPQCLDMVHSGTREMEDKLAGYATAREAQAVALRQSAGALERLSGRLQRLAEGPAGSPPPEALRGAAALSARLREGDERLRRLAEAEAGRTAGSAARRNIPPSMVSEMAERALISDEALVEGAEGGGAARGGDDVVDAAVRQRRLWCCLCA